MRVSSSLSFGSAGAASVRASFRSFILRASSSGSFTLSKRVALLGVRHRGGDQPLVGLRRQDLGVVGDVGGLDPARAAGVGREREELRLGRVQECLRLRDRRLAGTPGDGRQDRSGKEDA